MNSIKSSRYTDKRDEILIAILVAFLPLFSVVSMVH